MLGFELRLFNYVYRMKIFSFFIFVLVVVGIGVVFLWERVMFGGEVKFGGLFFIFRIDRGRGVVCRVNDIGFYYYLLLL